MELNNIKST